MSHLCGYYSETKRESCAMAFGHEERHFKYDNVKGAGQFSPKLQMRHHQQHQFAKKPASNVVGWQYRGK